MTTIHVYQSPVLQYVMNQYVYIVSAASYGLFLLVGYFWYRRVMADRRAAYLEQGHKAGPELRRNSGYLFCGLVYPVCSQQPFEYSCSGGTGSDGTVHGSDGRAGNGQSHPSFPCCM